MQTIQFKENQKEIWNKFVAENSSGSFLQAWEWGKFQASVGRKILRIGIVSKNFEEDNKKVASIKQQVLSNNLLAVALIVKHDLPFGQNYLYCPRGPVIKVASIKYQVSSIFNFLFEEIRKVGREEKAAFLKIDPPVETDFQRNISVPPLLGEARWGIPNNRGISNNFKKSLNEIQPRNTLILDLTKSEEELLKEMKPKTRYNIRLAKRKNVDIITPPSPPLSGRGQQRYFRKKFEKFWELTEETSRRDKFASHNKNYYWRMLENLGGVYENNLTAKLYLAEYKNETIAANIVLSFGDFCVYLHGASSSEHRNVMAPYLLQWRQILDAKKTGCKSYDFWGISQEAKDNWGGITRFKKGFGGKEKNYIGAYDLVFNRGKYYVYKIFRKIKNL